MSHALADAAESSHAAEAATADGHERDPLRGRRLEDALVRVSGRPQDRRLSAERRGEVDRVDRYMGRVAVRFGSTLKEETIAWWLVPDAGGQLDGARGIRRSIGRDEDALREVHALRRAARDQNRDRCAVDGRGRGAAERDTARSRSPMAGHDEQIGA